MSRIKFDDVMKFYPQHNQSIYNKIVKEQKSGSLVPFVGAGMSAFCGYKLWGDVLRELADFIRSEDTRLAVLKQIDDCAYEKAAQKILDAYPAMLDQLPGLISPSLYKECPQEKIQASAVFTLPYLFQKGLVITTNFDRVLEGVYLRWNNEQIQTVTPNEQQRRLLTQLRQNQSLGLFKLHGDIGDDIVSIDDLVFTEEQYAEKYADDSPLVKELIRWFENRRLLFLGCSLNMDRTIEVLKEVTLAQPDIHHYAIIGCKESDIEEWLKRVHSLGIWPIFYNNEDHGAVRVILERLLEDTDNTAYKRLCAASWVAPAATKEERRLLFDSDYFPFTGREQELKLLEDFCASNERISWWAVTGPGGMGKSRLVYEFTNQKRKEGWKSERFEARPSKGSNANSIEALDDWIPESPPTIVVLDDVQAYMEPVRRWLKKVVCDPRSQKLRVLLLERDGEDLDSASWTGTKLCDDMPSGWCHSEKFLYLEPMTNADLIAIMDNYAAAAGRKLDAESLLKTLERVDPELKRPMYAVAIADAGCQGKDPTDWDRKKVLDTLLDRELNFHFSRLRGMTGREGSNTLCSELQELLAQSCVQGVLLLDDAKIERYPMLAKKIDDLNMALPEFLDRLGVLRTVLLRLIRMDRSGKPVPSKREPQKVIALSCPDLIKEHLVLNLVLEEGKRDLLFPKGWEQNPGRLSLLAKLLFDYSDRLRDQSDYWETIFQATPKRLLPAMIYGHILVGYIAYYLDNGEVAIDRFERLYNEMEQVPEIAVEYANGLFYLTTSKDLEVRAEAAGRLDKLHQNHPGIPELVTPLAKGLVNLSAKQDLEGRTETVMQLEKICQGHPDMLGLVVQLAEGLVNLAAKQDLEGCTETVMRLEKMYQSHPDMSELAVQFANGLVNLSTKQDVKDLTETVAQLEKMHQSQPDIPKLAVQFAKGLDNLAIKQDVEDCSETVMRLESLYQSHPDISGVAGCLIYSLGYLSSLQELEGQLETIARCEEIYTDHPDREDVAEEFAGCLVDLAFYQKNEADVRCTLARSKRVLDRHPKSSSIQLHHAKTWFNLTLQQQDDDIAATVADIADFLRSNADAIPGFQEALEQYISDHPDHKTRYQPLLHL